MLRTLFAATLLTASVPAAAVTTLNFNFGAAGAVTNAASRAYSNGGLTLTATARRFFVPPGSLTNLSQTVQGTAQIQRSTIGIGVNGGASAPQIDTNNAGTVIAPLREAILLSGNQDFSLRGLRLSFVDNNDTLKVYGVNLNGTLVDLGYGSGNTPGAGGTIVGGLNGAATGLTFNAGLNAGTAIFSVAPTTYFTRYLFTTRVGGDIVFGDLGQGYRIDAITVGVPEPQTWALLIAGFGFVGVSMRRRRSVTA